ncbi:macrophage mannose receptor 1-like [Tachysurus ichikawai]
MKSPSILSLLLVLSGLAVGKTRYYVYITSKMSWIDAQSFCRSTYTDLAAIATAEENLKVMNNVQFYQSSIWIGMNRSSSGSWHWCDGEPTSIFSWKVGEPNNYLQNENCVCVNVYGWNDYTCSSLLSFMCHWNIILVKQKKTWEEALQYCKENYIGLACVSSLTKTIMADSEIAQADTVSVWSGLRFMNAKWFWLTGERVQSAYALPSCPAQNYRCGARNHITHTWENRDCNEELNFICYQK